MGILKRSALWWCTRAGPLWWQAAMVGVRLGGAPERARFGESLLWWKAALV